MCSLYFWTSIKILIIGIVDFFFPKDKKDYIVRQTRMTLLYKEKKKNLSSGESIVQLNKLKTIYEFYTIDIV